ncbi:MAG: FixH family protein [Saprospiraceae bacterium]
MKFNWPVALVLFFVLFIGTLVFILIKSRQYDHSLVIDDYYNQDIHYQEHYDKVKNMTNLTENVKISHDNANHELSIIFPSGNDKHGDIILYNPLSKHLDKKYSFDIQGDSIYKIPTDNLKTGRWKIKLDWKQNSQNYYFEEEIVL